MTFSSPNDTLRAQIERSFFLSNCSVLSGECFRTEGSLQTKLFLELAGSWELICASREGKKVLLVFPTASIAVAARDYLRSRGMDIEHAPPPSTWDDSHWFGSRRSPDERLFYRRFLDLASPGSRETDDYMHSYWAHNLGWYDLTRRIRNPSLGFFVVPQILSQIQILLASEDSAILSSTASNVESVLEADVKLYEVEAEHEGDPDETLVEAEAELASLLAAGSSNPESPSNASTKRQASSPPLEPSSPHPESPKRPRSAPPSLLPDMSSLDLVERPRSTVPTISVSPAPSESDTIQAPPPSSGTLSRPAAQADDSELDASLSLSSTVRPPSPSPSPPPSRSASPSDFATRPCLRRSDYLLTKPSRKYESLSQKGTVHTSLRIPRGQAGAVIGSGGEHIRRMRETSKVEALVENSLRDEYSVVHLVGGTRGQVNQVISMIKKKASTWSTSWEADQNYIALS